MKATMLYTTADKILMYDQNHLLGKITLNIFINIDRYTLYIIDFIIIKDKIVIRT